MCADRSRATVDYSVDCSVDFVEQSLFPDSAILSQIPEHGLWINRDWMNLKSLERE